MNQSTNTSMNQGIDQGPDKNMQENWNDTLYMNLLSSLLKTNILCYGKPEDLIIFENRFCIHPGLQPMFQASALQLLIDSMADRIIYEMVDSLHVGLTLFIYKGKKYIVGPYAKAPLDQTWVQKLLVRVKIPASYSLTINMYCSGLTLISSYKLTDTISSVSTAFTPGLTPYSFHLLDGLGEKEQDPATFREKEIDYSAIYRRYEMENHFMNLIAEGNVEGVKKAYREMCSSGVSIVKERHSFIYKAMNGITIIRVLARKAAESSGLSVITINEITQRAVQQLEATMTFEDAENIETRMLLELTEAVRNHLINKGAYSPLIAKVTEYLILNYTQECSLSILSEKNHVSDAYLSRQFKKETGQTLTAYISRLRCREAARLLKETLIPISDISTYVGYPDNNYFVKVFKKEYGLTPSQYRNSGEHFPNKSK